MIPIAHYLLAAALSNFMSIQKCQEWADLRIDRADQPEDWLLDVSISRNISTLRDAIEPRFEKEKQSLSNSLISDVIIGYYYIMYEDGKITIPELLKMAGAEADGGQSELECEDIYAVLNLLEGERSEIHKINESLDQLFGDCKILALKQWEAIETF